ncbi:hypothetical protein Taro_023942 [Colocasia esculenta]|uniref:Uncharacterized protein n=1 Tax=Colocasia esculenta TaxID=4460 RepID=A0A843VIU6_COLES|nr:hypothetical protein [Colocasia esculenta]
MNSARAAMEASSPPSVEAVRAVLRRNTLAYHLMGCPRDPRMAAIDSLWGEMRQLHPRMAESGRVAGSAPADPDPESGQTRPESGGVGLSRPEMRQLHQEAALAANRLKIQELEGEISLLKEEAEALDLQAGFCDEAAKLRKTVHDALKRIANCELAETVALERDRSDLQSRLLDRQATLVSLQSGAPTWDPERDYGTLGYRICDLDLAYHCARGPGLDSRVLGYRICNLNLAYHWGLLAKTANTKGRLQRRLRRWPLLEGVVAAAEEAGEAPYCSESQGRSPRRGDSNRGRPPPLAAARPTGEAPATAVGPAGAVFCSGWKTSRGRPLLRRRWEQPRKPPSCGGDGTNRGSPLRRRLPRHPAATAAVGSGKGCFILSFSRSSSAKSDLLVVLDLQSWTNLETQLAIWQAETAITSTKIVQAMNLRKMTTSLMLDRAVRAILLYRLTF